MLNRAYQAEALTSRSWLTADEAYGQNPAVRDWLADREIPYVLATRNDDLLTSPDGHRRQAKVLATIAGVDENGQAGAGWERRSVGPGAHGERDYDWTVVALDTAALPEGWGHWLLVRRQVQPAEGKTVRELAFYRCAGPAATPLRELIRVAGARWAIEECFQTAKNEAGLDHYQVRDLAGLVCPHHPRDARPGLPRRHPRPRTPTRPRPRLDQRKGGTTASGERLIPLSANEIRRLLAKLALTPVACIEQVLHWSRWRRKRQFQARACHYRRRGHPLPT